MTASERFWAKVDKSESCWEWTSTIGARGYGQFQLRTGKRVYAHRFSYEEMIGPIPEGLQIDHLCRNRRCVNPAHLEPVTQQENLRRGDGVGARNAAKTHCPNGHPYDVQRAGGGRRCRACQRAAERAHYHRSKQGKTDHDPALTGATADTNKENR